jgi:predicted membrane-bound mannosyltransferase
MIKKVTEILKNSEWVVLFFLAIVFVILRLPGAGLPLHQDEYKWPSIVNPEIVSDTEVPHPPLSQFIYRVGGGVVGYNTNFRFIPLFFGTINLLLLYWLLKILYSRREAVIASVIWIFSYFSVLASLMVDTDGEIMPFFFLLALIGYFKFLNSEGSKKYWWGVLLVASCVLGFFIKVSFLLAALAILADYLWSKKHLLNTGKLIKYFGGLVLGVFERRRVNLALFYSCVELLAQQFGDILFMHSGKNLPLLPHFNHGGEFLGFQFLL